MELHLTYMLKSTAIMGLFFLVYRFWLLPRRQFTFNRFFMLFGGLAAFAVPLISIEKIVVLPYKPMGSKQVGLFIESATLEGGIPWALIAFIGFGVVSGVIVGWLALHFIKVHRLISTAEIIQKKKPRLLLSEKAKAPFSFLQSIVFPKSMCQGPDYEVILAHEKVHINQRHSIDVLVFHFLLIIGWWNPLLWIYKRAVIENLEFLADETTVAQTKKTKDYQYILLHQTLPLK